MSRIEAGPWKNVVMQWNRSHGPFLQIRECDIEWNLDKQDLLHYRVETIDATPALIATATDKGVAFGLTARSLWVSLWGEIARGREAAFVDSLMASAARLGKTRIAMGADEFHFLPGVPIEESTLKLIEALRDSGFHITEECDFVGPAKNRNIIEAVSQARAVADRDDWKFALVDSASERERLIDFMSREFAGRWTRECKFWLERSDLERAFWATLSRGSGPVIGFARMAVRGREPNLAGGWAPGALRLPLGNAPTHAFLAGDGCLGPIGVAASERGKGAGKLLLGLVLGHLLQAGTERIAIDWTDAIKYYSPLNLAIVRRYATAWKSTV